MVAATCGVPPLLHTQSRYREPPPIIRRYSLSPKYMQAEAHQHDQWYQLSWLPIDAYQDFLSPEICTRLRSPLSCSSPRILFFHLADKGLSVAAQESARLIRLIDSECQRAHARNLEKTFRISSDAPAGRSTKNLQPKQL